ncbi:MAG: hypothetical protein AAF674_03345 [Pseudomonadota bacterium]
MAGGRDREGEIAAEIRRLRQGDSGINLIMLACVVAAVLVVLVLPDQPLPTMPIASIVAGWEVRAWLHRRAARLEAELKVIRDRQLAHYRLYMRSGRSGAPPDLRRHQKRN